MRKWADNPVHPPFAQYKTAVIDYAMNNAVQVPWYYFPSYDKLDTLINSGIDEVWNGHTTAKDYINGILPQVQTLFDQNKPR